MDSTRYGSAVDTSSCNFGIRHTSPKRDVTPGPSDYAREKHEDCGPSFSFISRHEKHKDDLSESPGPADYTPESHVDYTPSYSFGIRHEQQADIESPGPNLYAPEKHEDCTTSCSFGRRNAEHTDDYPGPATYAPEKHVDYTPSYSFGRHDDHRVNCSSDSILHTSSEQQNEEHKFY